MKKIILTDDTDSYAIDLSIFRKIERTKGFFEPRYRIKVYLLNGWGCPDEVLYFKEEEDRDACYKYFLKTLPLTRRG